MSLEIREVTLESSTVPTKAKSCILLPTIMQVLKDPELENTCLLVLKEGKESRFSKTGEYKQKSSKFPSSFLTIKAIKIPEGSSGKGKISILEVIAVCKDLYGQDPIELIEEYRKSKNPTRLLNLAEACRAKKLEDKYMLVVYPDKTHILGSQVFRDSNSADTLEFEQTPLHTANVGHEGPEFGDTPVILFTTLEQIVSKEPPTTLEYKVQKGMFDGRYKKQSAYTRFNLSPTLKSYDTEYKQVFQGRSLAEDILRHLQGLPSGIPRYYELKGNIQVPHPYRAHVSEKLGEIRFDYHITPLPILEM